MISDVEDVPVFTSLFRVVGSGSSSMAKIYKNVSGAKNAVKYYRTHFANYEYTIYLLCLGEKIDY